MRRTKSSRRAVREAAREAARGAPRETDLSVLSVAPYVTNTRNTTHCGIRLDERFAMCPEVLPQFRDVALYPHQRVLVQALIDLERDRESMVCEYEDNARLVTNMPVKIHADAILLAERVGSGKTYILLALIMMGGIPKARPMQLNFEYSNCEQRYPRLTPCYEVQCRFTGQALIKSTLIIVGSAVLKQWSDVITSRTSLSHFAISDKRDFERFFAQVRRGGVKYNIVLLRAGNTSGAFAGMPGLEEFKIRNSLNIIRDGLPDKCWARVIYDDYDTIGLPGDTLLIPALSTVVVSATQKTPRVHNNNMRSCDSTEKLLEMAWPQLVVSSTLRQAMGVLNTEAFIEYSTSIPLIHAWAYKMDHASAGYLEMIKSITGGENGGAGDVLEMLNGDALETAADTLGIRTTSIGDMFKKLLDKQYQRYTASVNKWNRLQTFAEHIAELPIDEDLHTMATLMSAVLAPRGPIPRPDAIPSGLHAAVESAMDEVQENIKMDASPLERILENLRGNECQTCSLPLQGAGVFVMRCCGITLCEICGIFSTQMKDTGERIKGSCPNCKTESVLGTCSVLISKDCDIEGMVKAHVTDTVAEEDAEQLPEPNAKIDALLKIIRGDPDNRAVKIHDLRIRNILPPRHDMPQEPGTPKKVIVFANYDETLAKVTSALRDNGIAYIRLCGTAREKAKQLAEFQRIEGSCVMVINSNVDCAGMNIQFATDVVYMHEIIDKNIEGQVLGRAHRIGRTCNLNVHYLLYDNESAD